MRIVRILATSAVLNPYNKCLTNIEKIKEYTCMRRPILNNVILPQATVTQVEMMTHSQKIAKYSIHPVTSF